MIETGNSLGENEIKNGFIPNLKLLLKGFVYPCWSLKFYKSTSKNRFLQAALFFLVFVFSLTSITAIQVALSLKDVGNEINGSYERGEFPNIFIENGIARTDGKEQFIFTSNRTVVQIDTSGQTQEIDTRYYSEGILLTRDEIHLVNDDGYRVFPLTELNDTFGNPLMLDKTNVLRLWNIVESIINLVVLFGGYLLNLLTQFISIVLIGLIIWGIISIKNQGVGFNLILITGIYANVPTSYLFLFLKSINLTFCGLRPALLSIIWLVVAIFLFRQEEKIPGPGDLDIPSGL